MYKRAAALIMSICFSANCIWCLNLRVEAESYNKQFFGDKNANAVIKNMDFEDVKSSNIWSLPAIYQANALGILKGLSSQRFGRTQVLTKEQALAVAYRAAGKEQLAQMAANEIDKSGNGSASSLQSFWSKGYLKLAADDSIISKEQFNATIRNQTVNGTEPLNLRAAAQRQEFGFWFAVASGIEPIYNQTRIYNNFNDYNRIDPKKVPYIESLLQNNIMNGDGRGNFMPQASITREQAAQVVYNAVDFILPKLQLNKSAGTIERISQSVDRSSGLVLKDIYLRNNDGKLDRISVTSQLSSENILNEQTGAPIMDKVKDIVVFKKNAIGKSDVLEIGDAVEFFYDKINAIKYMKVLKPSSNNQTSTFQDDGNVWGIVEEINGQMGYISVYVPYGNTINMRIINFYDISQTTIFKNYKKANINDIEPGDTIFAKISDEGNPEIISTVSNYDIIYANVLNANNTLKKLTIRTEDGRLMILDVPPAASVIENGTISSFEAINAGDNIRIMANISDKGISVKQIRIQSDQINISNIYKVKLSRYDQISDSIHCFDVLQLVRDSWEKTDIKGARFIKLDDSCKIYSGDLEIDKSEINESFAQYEAYVAVKNQYSQEHAVMISIRRNDGVQKVIDDTVKTPLTSSGHIVLENTNTKVLTERGTLAVKDGKIVLASSIPAGERVYVSADRDIITGDYKAGVIVSAARYGADFYNIYRGRIADIDETKKFSLSSFSKLESGNWVFANTQKTFDLTFDTKIVDEDGVLSQREFLPYGDSSFLNRVVYVVAEGSRAIMVSTAPYATSMLTGVVSKIEYNESPSPDPAKIEVKQLKALNQPSGVWTDLQPYAFSIPANCIILKNGKLSDISQIKPGDRIRALRRDIASSNIAIIFVEEW